MTTGANLARVGDPAVLKAELRIAETQAKDIQIGQTAAIDTRNGVIPDHVTRIDPAVENGTARSCHFLVLTHQPPTCPPPSNQLSTSQPEPAVEMPR